MNFNRLLLCCCLAAAVSDASQVRPPVPQTAKVSLSFAAERLRIGDDIQMVFRLQNTGKEPFSYSVGGDYRGSGFPTRCKVVVKNSRGETLPTPDRNVPMMGGRAQTRQLEAGGKFDQILPLFAYVSIDRPGVYTVQVTHDFGWEQTARLRFPVAAATLTIAEPASAEAKARVDELLKARSAVPTESNPNPGYTVDTQLRRLRHPVFLTPLAQRVNDGDFPAMRGIASIETVQATETMVRFLGHENVDVADAAAQVLSFRILSRTGLPAETWDPRLSGAVHAQARRFLASKDARLVGRGATLITPFATEEDLPLIRDALLDELGYREPRRLPQSNILDEPGNIKPLLGAVDALRGRGVRVDGTGNAGDILIYLRQLADPAVPRPPEEKWRNSLQASISRSSPTLRENAVRALPLPITAEWRPYLVKALDDEDKGVVRIACEMTGKSGDPTLIRPLTQIVEVERHPWALSAASAAAWELGARMELWEAWAQRLIERETVFAAFRSLKHVIAEVDSGQITGAGGNSNLTRKELFELRARWQAFLRENRAALVAGKRFSYRDPAILPLMVRADGQGIFNLSLPDGTMWPR